MAARLLAASLALVAVSRTPSIAAPPALAITHVTVIDCAADKPLADHTVVVEGDKITAVGPSAKVAVPADARVIDGKGKYLIPGLWDMHVHHTGKPDFAALYLANGVTGVRDMGTIFDQVLKERAEVAAGRRVGPRVVAAGTILDAGGGPFNVAVATPEAARRQVSLHKRTGADFIKVGSTLPRDTYLAIVAEAKEQGLPVAGHLSRFVGVREASKVGQKSIEHLDGYFVATSAKEDELTAEMAAAMRAADEARRKLEKAYTRENGVAYGRLLTRALGGIPAEAVGSHDPKKADEVCALFKSNGTWQCPTLYALRVMQDLGNPAHAADPRNAYFKADLKRFWQVDPRFQDRTPRPAAEVEAGIKPLLEAVGRMHKAGVPLLAGSDCTNPYVFPGFAIHDELALLVKAGLTPLDALRAATRNPARYLGREKETGSVEPGRAADLVLLDADPLEDIRNTTRIAAVVAAGRCFDRKALDGMLAEVRTAADGKK